MSLDDDHREHPVAALTALRSSLSTVTEFEQLDDDTALALRRASQLWERRLHRPLKWLIVGIPASCAALVLVDITALIVPAVVLFALTMLTSVVVVPLTAGLLREESHQHGVSTGVLRQLQRLDLRSRARAKTDAAFVLELQAARERVRRHRERPTLGSWLHRILLGP